MNERYQKEYLSKLCTVDEVAKIIESGDYVAVPPVQGEPVQLCEAIANWLRSGDLRNMTITNVWTLGKENPLFSEEFHNQVEIDSTFICDAYHWTVGAGAGHFVPANYTDVPRLFTRG